MNEKATKDMLSAGWSPNRRVAIDTYIKSILHEGLSSFEAAENFLQEYGGLKVSFHNLRANRMDTLIFGVEHAIALENADRIIENYSARVGKQLVPVGTAFRDYIILLIAEDGVLYGAYDGLLVLLGETPDEGISRILNFNIEAEFEEIP